MLETEVFTYFETGMPKTLYKYVTEQTGNAIEEKMISDLISDLQG